MAKPRTAEAAQLLALHSQNVHILPDNLAADWLEQKPYQWRNSAETKGNHRVHFRLAFIQRGALRCDDEMSVGAEIVVDPADIRHQEPVGVAEFPAIRKEQPRDQAPRHGLPAKFHVNRFARRPHRRREFARIVIPKPAAMDVHGVRAVQKVFQAGFNRRAKTRPHTETGPGAFAVMRELEWR